MTDPVLGLTSTEVAERVAAGLVNIAPEASSRSLGSIIRANTFTWFNALIGGMWVVMLLVAPIQDSLFGIVIIATLVCRKFCVVPISGGATKNSPMIRA
jgi:cation-transporting ATPase E